VAAVLQVPVPTSTQKLVDSATEPETPVTEKSYAPRGVVLDAVAVKVGVCAVALLKVSEDEEKLQVGYSEEVAPVGALVTEQLKVTVPVKELPGVTVIVTSGEVAPWATVTLPLLVRAKPVVVLVFGACQKSPQPVSRQARTGTAASNTHPNFPILIAAPSPAVFRLRLAPGLAYRVSPRRASCLAACLFAHPQPNIVVDASQQRFA
jgi:hypothetical protein